MNKNRAINKGYYNFQESTSLRAKTRLKSSVNRNSNWLAGIITKCAGMRTGLSSVVAMGSGIVATVRIITSPEYKWLKVDYKNRIKK